MKHGSLFSGIVGFDLAAEWMGWTNEFHCEWNEFGQRVLKHYWPKAKSYGDITTTDFRPHRGTDILTGGFPCQPYSAAGKRLGKEDDRHLWPEMLRAVREVQPTWVVGENVFGLINWNGGLVFDEVQADLETEGYEVQPYVLPAVSVNAPHRRDRVWFVAYSSSKRFNRRTKARNPRRFGKIGKEQLEGLYKLSQWEKFPTVSEVLPRDDGFSFKLDGITFSDWRNESIKAAGNAIVPQVAYEIFKSIELFNQGEGSNPY